MRGVTVRWVQQRRRRGSHQPSTSRRAGWLRRSAVGVALATLLPFGVSVAQAGNAAAAFDGSGIDFWVDSAMGPIKSRVFRAADGNNSRVVYALDGMRARGDLNGWEAETNIIPALTNANINVVMPVGGPSSFYADWNTPSNFFGIDTASAGSAGSSTGSAMTGSSNYNETLGKVNTYKWESFLTQDLPNALAGRMGFSSHRNGVFGLSMGGSAALTLAAYHPDQFSYAGSYSGYLNISAPGMREAMRVAMLSAGGYNIDAMAPPWGPQWLRMDPFVFAPRLKANNTRLWIAAGSGLPSPQDATAPLDIIQGSPLEALALANTRAFQVRMMTLGAGNVTYDFPNVGVHNWHNWEAEVYRMIPDMSPNIG